MTARKDAAGLMMTEQRRKGLPLVSAYGKGGFTIDNRRIAGVLLLLPHDAIVLPAHDLTQVTEGMLAPLFALDPVAEIMLVGTGTKTAFLPPELRTAFMDRGYSPDLMDTGAALRTFNILLLEDRRVAALLQPV